MEELLRKILSNLEEINKKIAVLDANTKVLMNGSKLAQLIERAAGTPLEDFSRASRPAIESLKPEAPKRGFKNFKFDTQDAAKESKDRALAQKQRAPAVPKIAVQGKLIAHVDGSPVPMPLVQVKVFDTEDNLVRETRTNRAGLWICHLPAGKYVALFEGEYMGKKLVSQNKIFDVPEALPEGQDIFDVI